MYNVTKSLLIEPKGQSYMEVGIHENVELVNIAVEISKSNNPYICFYFENEKGQIASKTEWPVEARTPVEQMTAEEKASYTNKINNQMARICMIAGQFVDKDELLFQANSFEEFINRIKTIVGDKYKGIKLRLKITYDYKDWATPPSYVKMPWIERMDLIPKEKSKIAIIAGVDKMEPSAQDTPHLETNPLDVTSTEVSPLQKPATNGDLPF